MDPKQRNYLLLGLMAILVIGSWALLVPWRHSDYLEKATTTSKNEQVKLNKSAYFFDAAGAPIAGSQASATTLVKDTSVKSDAQLSPWKFTPSATATASVNSTSTKTAVELDYGDVLNVAPGPNYTLQQGRTAIALGLDIQGGVSVILEAQPQPGQSLTTDDMDRAEMIIRNRIDKLGASEASIQRQGMGQGEKQSILVQLPGIRNPGEALRILGSTGMLEFVDVNSITDPVKVAQLSNPETSKGTTLSPDTYKAFMNGSVIKSASVAQGTDGGLEVLVSMDASGTKIWGDYTTTHVKQQVAIVLDGVVKSAPQVNEPILGGETKISGSFSTDEAKALATVLQTGALPVTLVPQETRSVGPTLGLASLRQGIIAVIVGLAIVAIYLIVFYRGLGLILVTALAVFASVFLGILAVLSSFGMFALSLPGIAGVVLTIGLAADSSILINERFKEEIRFGKTYRSAAQSGTRHAIGTSVDADLVTFVSALVLFLVAIGPVRGFALTLMIGIACDILMMILFKRPVIILLGESVIPKMPAFWGVPKEVVAAGSATTKKGAAHVLSFKIDFMGKRRVMFAISIVLLVVSIGAIAFRGLKFGIEFEGGTVINIASAGSATDAQVGKAFGDAGLPNPQVQISVVNGVTGFMVRSELTDSTKAQTIAQAAATKLGLQEGTYQVTTIGPGWGKNITNSATLALSLSIVAILLYVSLRFEYKMSVTAVIALIHDIIITLGIYALFGREVTPNTVAALLTILGFSLYDTIVVFHRIKENSVGLVKQSFMSMANESINEVLIRSINTSLTAVFPVLVMLFFGGSTLKDFAFALTIGTVSGTYSSIGVAAPLFAVWKETEPKYKALAKKFAGA